MARPAFGRPQKVLKMLRKIRFASKAGGHEHEFIYCRFAQSYAKQIVVFKPQTRQKSEPK